MSSELPTTEYFSGIDFNPDFYQSSSSDSLTSTTGKKIFLSYPVAQGSETFPSNITLLSTLTDSSGDVGTSGQLLSSTGSGVNWITSGNGYLALDVSVLPYTLPIPSFSNLYVLFTGTGSGVLTLPTTGVTTGTFINIKSLLAGSLNLSTSYILFSNTAVQSTYLGIFNTFSAYYNGSAWVQTSLSNRTDNLTVTSTLTVGSFGVNSLIMASSGTDIELYATTTANDIFLGQILPAGKTLRLCNTSSGASGASVHCSNIGIDGSNINNATAPTTGIIKLANAQTTGALYFGGGSTTAARTTGPIIIGADSTASGGINIGTGTNLVVPTVNTINIGSGTYGTNIKGSLTVTGAITADGGISLPSGDTLTVTGTISGTGNITTSGNISTTGSGTITSAGELKATLLNTSSYTNLQIGANTAGSQVVSLYNTSFPNGLGLSTTTYTPSNTQLGYIGRAFNGSLVQYTSVGVGSDIVNTGTVLAIGIYQMNWTVSVSNWINGTAAYMNFAFNTSGGITMHGVPQINGVIPPTTGSDYIMQLQGVANSATRFATFNFSCIVKSTGASNEIQLRGKMDSGVNVATTPVGFAQVSWIKIG